MKVVNQAFDSAWTKIANKYNNDAKAIDEARLKLAECVLAVARQDSRHAEQIERLPLAMFQISN